MATWQQVTGKTQKGVTENKTILTVTCMDRVPRNQQRTKTHPETSSSQQPFISNRLHTAGDWKEEISGAADTDRAWKGAELMQEKMAKPKG